MTRPDGSLPPAPLDARQDRFLKCRRRAGLPRAERAALDRRRAELVALLDALDVEAAEWFERRRALLDEALALHARLWPLVPGGWVRRPPRPGARWLPPLPADARPVEGYGLRFVCQELLARFGELALPELHALIHLYGYELTARHPVKALADAMRYELLEGRAERVRRGVYRTLVGTEHAPRDVDPLLGTPRWHSGTFRRRTRRPASSLHARIGVVDHRPPGRRTTHHGDHPALRREPRPVCWVAHTEPARCLAPRLLDVVRRHAPAAPITFAVVGTGPDEIRLDLDPGP